MRPKVAIFYTHFPHYRQAVFDSILNDSSLDVEIFYDYQGTDKTIVSGTAIKGHKNNKTFKFLKFYFEFNSIFSAFSKKYDYFIFLGNPYVLSFWISLLVLKIQRKKTAMWTHGWYKTEPNLKDYIRNFFYSLSDRLFLYNNRSKEIGINYGFYPDNISVIFNSLDYDKQKKCRDEGRSKKVRNFLSIPSKDYFLFVGRLIDSANIDFIIDALDDFNLHNKSIDLLIVGDGPNKKNLQKISIDKNYVIFLDAIYHEEELSTIFMNAKAVISPNKVGLLAMHSLAYGCPVITHSDMNFQMPEAEAIKHRKTGYLFKKGCKQSLIEMMKLSIKDSNDSFIRQEIFNNCIEVIELNYTPYFQTSVIRDSIFKDLYNES